MKLSFCTPCMNRFHHLKRTLIQNLGSIFRFGSDVEWILVNYNSQDEMDKFLRNYVSLTMSGHLTYYRTTDFPYFNYSHAKNLSHILASGDYVMNLDADNFIDIDGIERILRAFDEQPETVVQGFAGMVGLKKSHFLSLGGYDEDFHGWGHDDNDLIMRARRLGLSYLQLDCLSGRIEHSDEERIGNFDPALLAEFDTSDPTRIKMEMNERNGMLIDAKAENGRIRANENRIMGRARVAKNFSDEMFEVGWTHNELRLGASRQPTFRGGL